MSVLTGADLEHDVFGGSLTEVGSTNMPAGGSPANLNVEFLPGLVRTRGGAQVEQSYESLGPFLGSPLQARYTKSYAMVPEDQTQLALLAGGINMDAGIGLMASGLTQIGSVVGYGNVQPWTPYAVNPGFGGVFAKSSTQFGREYIGISEGRYGYDIPRQWDGTNYDRVSQIGPGLAPTVTDDTTDTVALTSQKQLVFAGVILSQIPGTSTGTFQLNSASSITPNWPPSQTVIQGGDVFTIVSAGVGAYDSLWVCITYDPLTTIGTFSMLSSGLANTTGTIELAYAEIKFAATVPSQIMTGGTITIGGSTSATFNSTWPVRNTPSDDSGLTNVVYVYLGQTGVSNGTGGHITKPGNIVAGLHQVSVSFITRQGYITRPAAPGSWTAAGSLQATVSNIPIGPSNVVGRLLIFTPVLIPPAMTGTFYSIRQTNSTISSVMQINDNTTTSLTVNFTDSDLISGGSQEALFGLIELGECAGSFPYAGRMFWWGELNSLQDFYGMEFNGGWNLGGGVGGSDLPLGWTGDSVYGGGGTRFQNGGVWLDAYEISTLATDTPWGMIYQTAYQDWEGAPIIDQLTQYGARVTFTFPGVRNQNPLTYVQVDLFSPGSGGILAFAQFLLPATAGYVTEIKDFNVKTPAIIPADTVLRVYAVTPSGANQIVYIDRVELYPTMQPINYTVLRASFAEDPESFDGETGLIQPVFSNGQAVRTVYTLRDSMYICTDRGTFVTKDVPGSEPAFWTVDPVSDTIGCTGPNAAGAGEDWEVKVNRYGLYIYLGREPEKLSQEIQSLWNRQGAASQINWLYGYKIWVSVDLLNKRVYIGAPINGATESNCIFVMDYNTLDTSEMIAQFPTLRFSAYTGRRVILEQGRKWTQWQFNYPNGNQMPLPCGTFLEQSDGTAEFVFGGGFDNNVYFIDATNRGNDNGAAVDSYYTTHFSPTLDEQQTAKADSGMLRSHMHLVSFVRSYFQGNGNLLITAYENTLQTISNTNPKNAFKIDLRNPAPTDQENTIDFATAERWAMRWETNELNGWWQCERFTRVVEQDPNNLVRGSNVQ